MRILKSLLISLVVLSSVFTPLKVNAQEQTSNYYSINEQNTSFSAGTLNFNSVNYKYFSDISSFGLLGVVYNNSSSPVSFKVTAYFYNSNSEPVAITTASQSLQPYEWNSYSHVVNVNVLDYDYSINDISYYSVKVETHNMATNNEGNANTYGNGEYALTSYDININVNEDNTFDITENIVAYFNVPKHGIYRTIPLKNTIHRTDGSTSTNRVKITNLNVDKKYTTSKENNKYNIKVGSASTTLRGEQTYKIGYTYNIGKDPSKNFDEFYFNIIGNEWDTTISGITFNITMPKEFDKNKLGFSSGLTGSTENSNVSYSVKGNVITGSYNGTLNSGEALTIRLTLDEGYFVGAGFKTSFTTYLLFLIPIASLLIAIFLWFKFGKDDQVVETVEFYPPKGFNSLEVGFLYNGRAGNKDVVSLLIYLANKGYIKISETEEKTLFYNSKGFKITKLKEYDGSNESERIFLNGLFKKKSISTIKSALFIPKTTENSQQVEEAGLQEVTATDLYNNFYITMRQILSNINNKLNRHKIFENATSKKSLIVILLIIISLLTIIGIPTLEYEGVGELVLTSIIILFYTPFYLIAFKSGLPLLFRFIWGGFTIIHSSIFFMSMPIASAIRGETLYLVSSLVGAACIFGMILCLRAMPKRTPYGNKMLGKLKGFKNFLETAEKDKLEAMVMEDPTYFYNILPYTYVLGVSDVWIKKFESIALQAPNWYGGSNSFNVVTFGSFINTTMSSAQGSMASSSSSSSGGGGSGGGSSGGGSGGGGGGSW